MKMSPDTGTSVAVNIAYLKTDVFGGHEAGNIEMGGGNGAAAAGPPSWTPSMKGNRSTRKCSSMMRTSPKPRY